MQWPRDILELIFDYKYEFEARERYEERERRFLEFCDIIWQQLMFNSTISSLI